METKTKCNIKIYVRFWYRSKYMNRKKIVNWNNIYSLD